MLSLAACGQPEGDSDDCPAGVVKSKVSGFCVPRYVSLKRDKVYARKGPGVDYATLWIYRARGMPLQVVAETQDWRRVCDPDGAAVWVHRSMVDGRRSVQALAGDPAPIREAPSESAPLRGLLNARALATLDRCQGAWCKVKVGGVGGWVPIDRVWGAAPAPQCR